MDKMYLAHRVAWAIHYGEWPKSDIDHIDGDKKNNRINNLRTALPAENLRNKKKTKANKSGLKGVSWDASRGRWRAVIAKNGRQKFLGYFDDIEHGHAAYVAASASMHGEFSNDGSSCIMEAVQ